MNHVFLFEAAVYSSSYAKLNDCDREIFYDGSKASALLLQPTQLTTDIQQFKILSIFPQNDFYFILSFLIA